MPVNLLAELVIRPFVEIVLYGLGYFTGQVVVAVFSLGRYSVESIIPPRRPRPKISRKQPASTAPPTVSADAATAIGLLAWAFIVVCAFLVWRVLSV